MKSFIVHSVSQWLKIKQSCVSLGENWRPAWNSNLCDQGGGYLPGDRLHSHSGSKSQQQQCSEKKIAQLPNIMNANLYTDL